MTIFGAFNKVKITIEPTDDTSTDFQAANKEKVEATKKAYTKISTIAKMCIAGAIAGFIALSNLLIFLPALLLSEQFTEKFIESVAGIFNDIFKWMEKVEDKVLDVQAKPNKEIKSHVQVATTQEEQA